MVEKLSIDEDRDRFWFGQPLLLQALYPTHFGVFVRAAEEWSDSPDVTTSLMKFMMEFVYNKVIFSHAVLCLLFRSDAIHEQAMGFTVSFPSVPPLSRYFSLAAVAVMVRISYEGLIGGIRDIAQWKMNAYLVLSLSCLL